MYQILNEQELRAYEFRYYGAEEAIARATARQREQIARELAKKDLAGSGVATPPLGQCPVPSTDKRDAASVAPMCQAAAGSTPATGSKPSTAVNLKSLESYL